MARPIVLRLRVSLQMLVNEEEFRKTGILKLDENEPWRCDGSEQRETEAGMKIAHQAAIPGGDQIAQHRDHRQGNADHALASTARAQHAHAASMYARRSDGEVRGDWAIRNAQRLPAMNALSVTSSVTNWVDRK